MAEMMPQNNTLQMLLNTFTGKKSTTSTSSGISSAGMSEMLKSILGSTQGLAQLSQGQKSAGLYNSTVNQQLTNDLLTRSAAEVSKAGSGQTQTTKVAPQVDPQKALLATLGLSAGKSLLGPTIAGVTKKYGGLDDLGTKLADTLGYGSQSVSDAASISAAGDIGGGLSFGAESLDALISSVGSDFANSVASDALGSIGDSVLADAGGGFLDQLAGAFGLKDGGLVKDKLADGGSVRRRPQFNSSNPDRAESTASKGDAVSEGVAAPGSSVSLGALGSIGLGVMGMNPVSIALGVGNAISSITTGKSLLANLISKMAPADSPMAATPESIAQAFAAFDSSLSVPSIGDAAIGDSGIGPGSNAGSAEGATGGSGDADGGKIPHQGDDPRGINDTVPSTIRGKKGPDLSGDEFIIPADVVRAKGAQFFEELVEQFHVPVALQGR